MAESASDKNKDNGVPTEKKLDELYKLIDGNDIAMLTSRRADGRLVSRPMATQERITGMDLWFVTDISSPKIDELESDPEVNLAYYNTKSREYVSVSGTASVTQNRDRIRELYKPDWKAWFAADGDPKSGTPDDPRIALIAVEAHSVEYLKIDKPRAVVLFEVAKALVTGTPPKVGKERMLSDRELHTEKAREAR